MGGLAEKQSQHTLGNKCPNIHSWALTDARVLAPEVEGLGREAVNVSWTTFQVKPTLPSSTRGWLLTGFRGFEVGIMLVSQFPGNKTVLCSEL